MNEMSVPQIGSGRIFLNDVTLETNESGQYEAIIPGHAMHDLDVLRSQGNEAVVEAFADANPYRAMRSILALLHRGWVNGEFTELAAKLMSCDNLLPAMLMPTPDTPDRSELAYHAAGFLGAVSSSVSQDQMVGILTAKEGFATFWKIMGDETLRAIVTDMDDEGKKAVLLHSEVLSFMREAFTEHDEDVPTGQAEPELTDIPAFLSASAGRSTEEAPVDTPCSSSSCCGGEDTTLEGELPPAQVAESGSSESDGRIDMPLGMLEPRHQPETPDNGFVVDDDAFAAFLEEELGVVEPAPVPASHSGDPLMPPAGPPPVDGQPGTLPSGDDAVAPQLQPVPESAPVDPLGHLREFGVGEAPPAAPLIPEPPVSTPQPAAPQAQPPLTEAEQTLKDMLAVFDQNPSGGQAAPRLARQQARERRAAGKRGSMFGKLASWFPGKKEPQRHEPSLGDRRQAPAPAPGGTRRP